MARYDESCLPNCTFIECVNNLNSVILRGTLHQVKEYVHGHCCNAVHRADSSGLTPLHVAASCGKTDVLNWLLLNANGSLATTEVVNYRDWESGWTALHRAIYYGRVGCAVALLQNNASIWLEDKDGCNVLSFIAKDVAPWFREPNVNRNSNVEISQWNDLRKTDPTDLYTWGINENMTLIHGSQKSRKVPEIVEFFARKKMSIQQVALCKFHTLVLTYDGLVYACGNGRGGRLGIGQEDTFINPQLIETLSRNFKIIQVAAAVDHSVFVSDDGQVFVCGMNQTRSLGLNPPPNNVLVPVKLITPRDQFIVGCAAGSCHTAIWTNTSLFTCGTNAGQLGHAKGDLFITTPRQVSSIFKEESKIISVDSSDAAIVIATSQGSIFLLHKFTVRKIVTKHMDVIKVQVGGGNMDSSVLNQFKLSVHGKALREDTRHKEDRDCRIIILKKSGDVICWSSQHSTIDCCSLGQKQLRWITDVAISSHGNNVMFVSVDGTVFFGQFAAWYPAKVRKSHSLHKQEFFSSLELLESDSSQTFNLEQVPCAFRTHTAVLGPKGRNAAVLQSDPRNFITQVPVVEGVSISQNLSTLLKDADTSDLLHNITVCVKRKGKQDVIHPVHSFILASRSPLLFRLITENHEHLHDIAIENVHPKIVYNLLQLLYTGTCEMLQHGQVSDENLMVDGLPKVYWQEHEIFDTDINTKDSKRKKKESCIVGLDLLQKTAAKFGVSGTKEAFDKVQSYEGKLLKTVTLQPFSLHRTLHTSLFDCNIECDDGKTFQAHKCVLSARVPYFQGMLLSPWMESTTLDQGKQALLKVPVPSDVFSHVLDFAYTDLPTSLRGATSIESLCEVLAAADLLLMDRLKQVAEVQIVPLLTLKNVISVIEVAQAFNSKQLYDSCLQFSCQNLASLLHTAAFHAAEPEVFDELERVYRSNIPHPYNRVIACTDTLPVINYIPKHPPEDLVSFADDLNPALSRMHVNTSPKRRKQSLTTSSSKAKRLGHKMFGVMLSDLLHPETKSADEVMLEKILIPPQAIQESDENVSQEHQFPESKKPKPKEDLQPAPPESKDEKTDSLKWPQKNFQARKKDNFVMENKTYSSDFPSLANNPSEKSNISKGFSGTPITVRNKKLSQKEKRRLREKESVEPVNEVVSPTKPTSNPWGIPVRTPIHTASIWETTEEVKAISPVKSPTTIRSTPGPWHQFQFDGTTSFEPQKVPTSVCQSPSFIDIVESEQLSCERAEKNSKKTLVLIQLEDEAMDQLKQYYQESRTNIKNDRRFFTVTRVSDHLAMTYVKEKQHSSS